MKKSFGWFNQPKALETFQLQHLEDKQLGSGQLQFIDKPSNVKLQDTDAGQSTVTAQWRVLNVQIYAQFQCPRYPIVSTVQYCCQLQLQLNRV